MIFHAVNSIIKKYRNRKLFEGSCTDGSKKLLQQNFLK
ncbi:unknown [Prevotella sp. CAG:1185]|nr:unknown [Prevotella sp. CAG:1185]